MNNMYSNVSRGGMARVFVRCQQNPRLPGNCPCQRQALFALSQLVKGSTPFSAVRALDTGCNIVEAIAFKLAQAFYFLL